MKRQITFATLRDNLTEYYPDLASARRVVEDAGIDSSLIAFSTQAKNNWHNILSQAENQGKIKELLTVVLKDYGENPDLRNACRAYHTMYNQNSRNSSNVAKPAAKPKRTALKESESNVPQWFSSAGVIFGSLTLLFFMALVIASLFDYEVPFNSRFSVVVVLALGSALATSFIGGTAAVKGRLPVPILQDHPLQFSAGGGIAVMVIIFLVGYGTYVTSPDNLEPQSLPFVYLMDSKEPAMVYNTDGQGTNTDDIRDILRYLPIKPPIEELVHTDWDDSEIISQLEPDLIIIHHSAFYTTTTSIDPAKRLGSFLQAMENTGSKFLIYSRSSGFSDEQAIKQYYETTYPFLKDRIDVLYVPLGEESFCTYWDCSETREKLRGKVKSLLGLP